MLEIIIITLFLSTILNVFFKKLHMPTIIGYITTGVFINYGSRLYSEIYSELDYHKLQEVAEFGVVFLMFTIGLEFSLEHLKKMKKEVFIYGTLQVFVTTIVIAFLAQKFFNLDIKAGIIIGAALSLASTAIILKLFNETGETNSTYGKNIVGILIFQDLAVIPILLMISVFSSTDSSIGSLLSQTALGATMLLGIMWLVGKYLLNPFFKYTLETQSQEIFLGSIFLIVFSASYVAHILGFSYSLGAFIAGMLIAETHYKHQVESDLIPFRELLLGIFFITVGIQLDFLSILKNINTIALILPILMLLKFFIIAMVVSRQRTHNILKTGLALLGLGEFGLVIIDLAKVNHLIDLNVAQTLSATIILSLILTPIGVKNLHSSMLFIKKYILRKDSALKPESWSTLENHVVVIGYGSLGHHLAQSLNNRHTKYLIIEGNQTKFEYGKKENQPIILGNATQKNILESVNIAKARSAFISVGNSRKLLNICLAVRSMNDNIKMTVKVHTYEEKQMLEKEFLHNIRIIVETEETAKIMIEAAVNMLAADKN